MYRIISRNLARNVFRPRSTVLTCYSMTNYPSLVVRSVLTQRSFSSASVKAAKTYQRLQPREHVLKRPEPYLGSTEKCTEMQWVLNKSKIVKRECTFVPAFMQIIDEIIVNASDNQHRVTSGKKMSEIRIEFDEATNIISISNDGPGIPIVLHEKENMYVPELIFGHLLTSSNYDDTQQRYTGGRHGYGAKLTNIFSSEFKIEIIDKESSLIYKQEFKDNMSIIEPPIVTQAKKKGLQNLTKVTFRPDLSRFGLKKWTKDLTMLLKKRIWDLAASVSASKVKVYMNDIEVPINSWQDYLLALEQPTINPIINHKVNDQWQISIGCVSARMQDHISFVNGISTPRGGTHVQHIIQQVTRYVLEYYKKTHKDMDITPALIKQHLFIFVNCFIVNPTFDSQTKDALITPVTQFANTCKLTDGILSKLVKQSGLLETITEAYQKKQKQLLKAKTKPKGKRLIIPKLDDANWAGTKRSSECSLILTEGDSAKALALAGLAVLGRDKYGVFPLKGKVLNVRDASSKQVMGNDEINSVMNIMGLQPGERYTDKNSRKDLRYGKIILMTDQDHDGSHIKGLFINFLHHFWPHLLHCNIMLEQFITPIIKAFPKNRKRLPAGNKNSQEKLFYSIPEFELWKNKIQNFNNQYSVKYYKGLGTNTAAEARVYFKDLKSHLKPFIWKGDDDDISIDMAFAKDKADARKEWILAHPTATAIPINPKDDTVTYSDFVHKELVLFSLANNVRSIASLCDGLKPGQRKILWSCFRRNLKDEVKVAQLGGYVSEHSGYHHGEMSLFNTIINMAQDFVGSNNINLLFPSGQFGTRHLGGSDAASPRYIFTKLTSYARLIFPESDDILLKHKDDDGLITEPEYYLPIIPFVLVNGCTGVGTGFSTFVPSYNPLEIINNIRRKLNNQAFVPMNPYIKGFHGKLKATGDDGYTTKGVISISKNRKEITISELPPFRWTTKYKEFLITKRNTDKTTANNNQAVLLKDFTEHHTTDNVSFNLILLKSLNKNVTENDILHSLRLESKISTSNMHLFNHKGEMMKYSSPLDIMEEFYPLRMELYRKRHEYLLQELESESNILKNRVRFINMVISGELILSKKKYTELVSELKILKFDDPYDDREYSYLLSQPLSSLTLEKVSELRRKQQKKEDECEKLRLTTPEQLWIYDLEKLETELNKNTK